MPDNMQRRGKVAQLDDSIEPIDTQETPEAKENLYRQALIHLESGLDVKRITDRMVKNGTSRAVAHAVATKVWEENPAVRRGNARTLVVVGISFCMVTVVLMAIRFFNDGTFPTFTPIYLFLIPGFWFIYKGFSAYRKLN